MIEYTLIAGLAGFYFLNLALGFYQGRNIRTVSTYVFGHRYSTGVLLLTLTGTFIGADYLTHWFISGSWRAGGGALICVMSIVATGLIATYYIFPKLRAFKNWYTLGDIVRQAYGSKHAQLVVDGISLVSSVILLSAQFLALKRVATLLGVTESNTAILCLLIVSFALVVVIYASRAGTPGVVSTDVLQMILILGSTVFITYKVLTLEWGNIHVYGLQDLWCQLKSRAGKNPFKGFLTWGEDLRIMLLASASMGLILFSPAFIKRVGMASDNRQLKHSMLGFMTVFSFFILMIVLIGYGIFIIHGKVPNHNVIFPTLLKVIGDSIWGKLLLLLMVMAAVMSTADSILTAASLCAVRIAMNLKTKNNTLAEPKLNDLQLVNVLIGFLAFVLALVFMHKNIIEFVMFAMALLCGLIPCLVGISLGIKKSSKALLGSMACFMFLFIGVIILVQVVDLSFLYSEWARLSLNRKYRPLLPFVVLLSIVVYLVSEAIVHKGLKWEVGRKSHHNNSLWGGGRKGGVWQQLVRWAEERLVHYESRGVLLILLCVVTSLTSMLSTTPFSEGYLTPMTVLMLLVFVLCTFNLFPEQWYAKLRIYYPLYWVASLCICVPFASLLRWLYHPTLLNALYLVFVPVIMHGFIGRKAGLGLSLLGYGWGFLVYKLTADARLGFEASHSLVPLSFLGFSTLLSWGLLGYHTQRSLDKAKRPKMWAASWGYDFENLSMEAQFTSMLEHNPLPKGEKAQNEEMKKRLATLAKHLQQAIDQSRAFRQLILRDNIRTSEIESLSLIDLLDYACKAMSKEFQAMTHVTGKVPMRVKVFKPIFVKVLSNLVHNAWKVGATKIDLTWDKKAPMLYIKDNGPGMAEEKLATLFEWENKDEDRGVGLPFIKEALAKMGALIDVQSSDEGTVFMILFEQESTL